MATKFAIKLVFSHITEVKIPNFVTVTNVTKSHGMTHYHE